MEFYRSFCENRIFTQNTYYFQKTPYLSDKMDLMPLLRLFYDENVYNPQK